MAQQFATSLSLVLASMALGWTAYFSFIASPQAFRDLDAGRAKRFIRNAMKGGHPIVAIVCLVAGAIAFMGAKPGGAIVLASCGALFFLACWTLAPRDDDRAPPGGKRKLDTARVVAALLTAMIMLVLVAGICMLLAGI